MADLNDLGLDRNLYKAPLEGDSWDASIIAAMNDDNPIDPIATGGAATDVNNGSIPINAIVLTGTIPTDLLDVSNFGWTQSPAFSSTSATQVNWGAGTFISANGTAYSISAGNTGTMAAKTYIYLDLNVSSTAYQVTTISSNSVGVGKVLIAVAQNNASAATYSLNVASQIVSDNILANSIDASKIVAGSITATQISVSYVYAGTISANNVTAGTLTGSTVQTAASGQRVVMSSSTDDLKIYDGSSNLRVILGNSAISFYTNSSTLVGSMYASSSTGLIISTASYSVFLDNSTGAFYPYTNFTNLGSPTFPWSDIYMNGTIYVGGVPFSGSMVYPGAGIALSTGSAWGSSIANNSANWNTAYGWGNHASAGYSTVSGNNTFTGSNTFNNSSTGNYFNWVQATGSSPQVGSNSARFTIKGSDVHYTSLVNDSDRILKKNIEPVSYGLDTICALKPVFFEYITPDLIGGKKIGFIAQDIEPVIPEIVSTNDDGIKGLSNVELIPILVKAIQELKSELELLKSKK